MNKKFIKQISKKLGIEELTLVNFLEQVNKHKMSWESLDKDWKYPQTGDSQVTNPMLDAMFHIEYRRGIIIFLPFHNLQED